MIASKKSTVLCLLIHLFGQIVWLDSGLVSLTNGLPGEALYSVPDPTSYGIRIDSTEEWCIVSAVDIVLNIRRLSDPTFENIQQRLHRLMMSFKYRSKALRQEQRCTAEYAPSSALISALTESCDHRTCK